MKRQDYLLTIQVPIKAFDDIEARMEGTTLLAGAIYELPAGESTFKLQRVFSDRPPEKVSFPINSEELMKNE